MGSHPVNLAFRFIIEIAALIFIGIWGWQIGEGLVKYIMAIGIPIVIAAIWGIFNVPGDPSRSGKAPVPVPGFLRLFIELSIFSLAIWTIFYLESNNLACIFAAMIVIHYVLSYDRILWIIKK